MSKPIGAILIVLMFAIFVGTAVLPPKVDGLKSVAARRATAIQEARQAGEGW